MDYNTFKTFIHPELLNEFTKVKYTENSQEYTYEQTLVNSFNVAIGSYQTLANQISTVGIYPKFDQDTYVLKSALVNVYKWIIHSQAFLEDLSLSSLRIEDSDIYDHFYQLLKDEQQDVEDMRKEVMDEYMRLTGPGANGVRLGFQVKKDAYGINRSSRRSSNRHRY